MERLVSLVLLECEFILGGIVKKGKRDRSVALSSHFSCCLIYVLVVLIPFSSILQFSPWLPFHLSCGFELPFVILLSSSLVFLRFCSHLDEDG